MATGGGKTFDSGPIKKGSKTDVIFKKDGTDPDTKALLRHIFIAGESDYDTLGENSYGSDKELDLCHLGAHIDSAVNGKRNAAEKEEGDGQERGRLGPKTVTFDYAGNSGTIVVEADRLGVASHSNFSTIRANAAVYQGKWVYELMLGSKGVMQVGWCTLHCKFSQEEGVGDTENSYAYDGNRIRKWNIKTLEYGEPWLTGDVITCAIDCDDGTITFARNGKSLGTAFDRVQLGPSFGYFPAVSLSLSENLRANFGATPLRYPLEGYRPLQDPPMMDLVAAQQLFGYLERLLPSFAQVSEQEPPTLHADPLQATVSDHRSAAGTLMLAANHILERLAPLLKNAYIVEIGLFRLLLKYSNHKDPLSDHVLVTKTLDLLWALLQDHELKHCMEHLVISLLSSYRFSPVDLAFTEQQIYLTLTLAVLRHEKTRKFLLKNILFDKVKFPIFMHVKPPDDAGLVDFIPTVWWRFSKPDCDDDDEPELDPDEVEKKNKYLAACEELRKKVGVLETIQVEIIKTLLINKDNKKGATTRFVFLHKFREFLKDNLPHMSRQSNQCPLPVSLCFLHRLIRAVQSSWDEYAMENPEKALPSSKAYVPCRKFFDDSINYFDINRVGGILSYLKKTYKDQLQSVLGVWQDSTGGQNSRSDSPSETLSGLHVAGERDSPPKMSSSVFECHGLPSSSSLVELLDGLILLYLVAHKQLGKMCTLRENLGEYVNALMDTQQKSDRCPSDLPEVRNELKNADSVLREKVSEQSRQMAWIISVIYTEDKQTDIVWLLQSALRSIERASQQDKLFTFLPDFYIETAINSYHALRAYFHPTQDLTTLSGFDVTLVRFALFLSDHFSDPRIVQADVKDSLIQALACFVCYRMSLQALESIPKTCRMRTIKSLLAPYENRSWAQTNWILVRLWKGCGFGFRYKHLPHLMPAKNQQQEIGNASLQKPCPSLVYQEHIKEFLSQDPEGATKLLDSLLNQLNWAFSEFVGMLQELQQITSRRPALAIVDNRQLKICATCFDISVGLLRVVEMIVNLVPEILTDWNRPSAELLLCRLFQLLMQVLSRVTSKSNMFDTVVSISIPGLETVDHFPILTAVAGILVQLVSNGPDASKERALETLLAEPGLQISSLEFLLGGAEGMNAPNVPDDAVAMATDSQGNKIFSLRTYTEVDVQELSALEELIESLRTKLMTAESAPEIHEDVLCEICYARPKGVKFTPCGHQSCRSCIMQHLMSRKECFFCKADVKGVADLPNKS